MKKVVIILAVFLTACTTQEIVTIDGCQYIQTDSYVKGYTVENLTHKGNCNNPIHYQKVEPIKDTLTFLDTAQFIQF